MSKANGELTIEKGIAIPKRKGRGPSAFTAALAEMKIVESVFVKRSRSSVSTSIMLWRKNHSACRFTCRTVEGGVRVWRVK